MTLSDVNKNCPYFPHSGPVGWLPAPNNFHFANEFAKGKMFWNRQLQYYFTFSKKNFI